MVGSSSSIDNSQLPTFKSRIPVPTLRIYRLPRAAYRLLTNHQLPTTNQLSTDWRAVLVKRVAQQRRDGAGVAAFDVAAFQHVNEFAVAEQRHRW